MGKRKFLASPTSFVVPNAREKKLKISDCKVNLTPLLVLRAGLE
jgi:hypothetical protein